MCAVGPQPGRTSSPWTSRLRMNVLSCSTQAARQSCTELIMQLVCQEAWLPISVAMFCSGTRPTSVSGWHHLRLQNIIRILNSPLMSSVQIECFQYFIVWMFSFAIFHQWCSTTEKQNEQFILKVTIAKFPTLDYLIFELCNLLVHFSFGD